MSKQPLTPETKILFTQRSKNFSFNDLCLKEQFINEGQSGCYFKLDSQTGLKVFNKRISKIHETSESLLNSDLSDIRKEFLIQQELCQKFEFIPKVHSIEAVFCNTTSLYVPAIKMEHINGVTFDKTTGEYFTLGSIATTRSECHKLILSLLFEKAQMEYNDLHTENLLVVGTSLKLIDFGYCNKIVTAA